MQDRSRQFDEIFLQRTAGPYIKVNRVDSLLAAACPLFPKPLRYFPKSVQRERCATAQGEIKRRMVRLLPALDRSRGQACHDLALREHRQQQHWQGDDQCRRGERAPT